MSYDALLSFCQEHSDISADDATFFIRVSHRLGHLTHYEHDPVLHDIVVLKPDWLATAISYVMDDAETRERQGLVTVSRLAAIWSNDAQHETQHKKRDSYPPELFPVFIRLMERFDLAYEIMSHETKETTYLIAQLVTDKRPEHFASAWEGYQNEGDIEQSQICLIRDKDSQLEVSPEGLLYRLIVRFHRHSLGREDYCHSIHWQRGLVLDDGYNGRAFVEHKNNRLHITVRAAYPQNFLFSLTNDVRYLVDDFWDGLQCDITVPCHREFKGKACQGLFEVKKLMESKHKQRLEQPCPVCNEWEHIDTLLANVSVPEWIEILQDTNNIVKDIDSKAAAMLRQGNAIWHQLEEVGVTLSRQIDLNKEILLKNNQASQSIYTLLQKTSQKTLQQMNNVERSILSKIEASYNDLLQMLQDEGSEAPRLFIIRPVARRRFNPHNWTKAQFEVVLYCEANRKPLHQVYYDQTQQKNSHGV